MTFKLLLVAFLLFLVGTFAKDHGKLKEKVAKAKAKASSWFSHHEPVWWNRLKEKAKDSVLSGADTVHISKLIEEGGGVHVKSCGRPGDAMLVDSVRYNPLHYTIEALGHLEREVTGGEIKAKIHLSEPPVNASGMQRLKRAFVFIASGRNSASEPLCHHFSRGDARVANSPARAGEEKCPLQVGVHTFHFNVDRLPSAISAGVYKVQLHAADDEGRPVACVEGSINIPMGPKGELVRRLTMHGPSLYTPEGLSDEAPPRRLTYGEGEGEGEAGEMAGPNEMEASSAERPAGTAAVVLAVVAFALVGVLAA